MSDDVKNKQMKDITDRLEKGISELFKAGKYKEYLDTISKFHKYSFSNTILIAMQNPDATLVAGYRAWMNKFQRYVMKGERGIKIIAPCPEKVTVEHDKIDPETQLPVLDEYGLPVIEKKEEAYLTFKVATVFDVSQTDGKELPTYTVNELEGCVDDYVAFFDTLQRISPVPIVFENITDGSRGYFSSDEQHIGIKQNMSELQTIKTAVHEIAHSLLHNYDKDTVLVEKNRNTREVEAESVAYCVCQHYGIDTSDYSFGYIAEWGSGKETKELKASLETIRDTSAMIISSIDDICLDQKQKNDLQNNVSDEDTEEIDSFNMSM